MITDLPLYCMYSRQELADCLQDMCIDVGLVPGVLIKHTLDEPDEEGNIEIRIMYFDKVQMWMQGLPCQGMVNQLYKVLYKHKPYKYKGTPQETPKPNGEGFRVAEEVTKNGDSYYWKVRCLNCGQLEIGQEGISHECWNCGQKETTLSM